MKKIYLLGLTSMFALAMNAQTTMKVKNPLKKRTPSSERIIGGSNSVQQVAGSITCATQYVAGTSMTLNMTLTLSNLDEEYVDMLTITFPAGITPTAAVNPFPGTQGGGQPAEALNPIVGQVVSWGDDDNVYGGIETPAPTGTPVSYNFTVDVTVAPGLTGNQIANYDASGDGFGPSPGTLTSTFTIFPAGALAPNLTTTFVAPLNATAVNNCNYGMDTIVAQIKNLGNTTESNINVMYRVNGGSAFTEVIAGPLAPGDSAYVFWLTATYNFNTSNVFNIQAYTALAGDINMANDTAGQVIVNSQPVPLTSVTYSNPVETAYQTNSVSVSGTAAAYTGLSTATFHAGLQAFFTTVPVAAPAGAYAVFLSTPCLDVVLGDVYRISYWRKVNNAPASNAGTSGIFTGLTDDGTTMTNIKPYSLITPTAGGAGTSANWTKDSVDYTATATETRYFAISGAGVVSAAVSFNVRVDDINIVKISAIGIAENISTDAVSIFPNPSAGVFTVKATENNSSVAVYSIIGENVYSAKLAKGNNAIDLSNVAAGTYIVKVNNGGTLVTKRVVINK